MRLARAIRILCGALAALLTLFAIFLVWRAFDDYHMQVRNHWDYRCYDIIIPAIVVACISAGLATASLFAYRKSTAWERRLHGTP
jgi:hypothetical protein